MIQYYTAQRSPSFPVADRAATPPRWRRRRPRRGSGPRDGAGAAGDSRRRVARRSAAPAAASEATRPNVPANAPMLAVDVMKNATRYAVASRNRPAPRRGARTRSRSARDAVRETYGDDRARACVAARSRSVRVPVPVPAAHETSASTETDDHPRSTSVSSASRRPDTSSLAWSPWFFRRRRGKRRKDARRLRDAVRVRQVEVARAHAVLPGRIASGEAGGDRASFCRFRRARRAAAPRPRSSRPSRAVGGRRRR